MKPGLSIVIFNWFAVPVDQLMTWQKKGVVEARNATALANALNKLLADPELRLRMGQRGRERVLDEFSQERIVGQVLALYRGVLS